MIHSAAQTVNIDGQSWAVGAVWSEANYERRPGNLYKLTKEKGFDPKRTLVTHIAATNQLGWYEFGDESSLPRRAACLSQLLVEQAIRRTRDDLDLPVVVVLNLGELSWMAILDRSGALVPEYERCGSMDGLREFLQDDEVAGLINSYRANEKIIDNADEAIAWLFDGIRPRPAYADRVYARSYGAIVGGIIGTIALASVLLLAVHEHQVAAKKLAAERAAMWLAHSRALAASAEMTKEKLEQENNFQLRLQNYWNNYPRPWVDGLTGAAAASACESYVSSGVQNAAGWERTLASCTFSGSQMMVSETWKRGRLANITSLPDGATSDMSGDEATDEKVVVIPNAQHLTLGQINLPTAGAMFTAWQAYGQEADGTFVVKQSPFVPFKPPVPPFVDPSKVAAVQAETLVIWQDSAINIETQLAPSDGWSFLNTKAFLVKMITVNYDNNGVAWRITGDEYAQP